MTRKRGTCVLVGLPPGEFPVPLFDVVANCITIRGSFVGNREDMAEAFSLSNMFDRGQRLKLDIGLNLALCTERKTTSANTAEVAA